MAILLQSTKTAKRKTWNLPSDIRVSENCIDQKFVNGRKRQDKTTFHVSRRRNGAPGIQPHMSLMYITIFKLNWFELYIKYIPWDPDFYRTNDPLVWTHLCPLHKLYSICLTDWKFKV